MNKLARAKELAQTEPDEAMRLCSDVINEDPNSDLAQTALFLTGWIMLQAERFGMAYHIYQRCAQLKPNLGVIWSNMAACLEDIDPLEAARLFRKAQKLDKDSSLPFANEALIHLKEGNPDKCLKLCDKALKLDPSNTQATHNASLAKLMKRDWSGWKDWNDTLGVMGRTALDYGLPDWDGKSPGKILVYGEQGVGDEIMYASILEDLMKTHEIVINTDSRLKKLFNRSFDCPVYGTRFKDESEIRLDHELDYQIAIGQLPYFFRSNGEFPGKPYLKVNPDQEIMYRALFDTLPGKKIGIAWTGGGRRTGKTKRSMSLQDLSPLLNEYKNTFISLEYNPVDPKLLEQYNIKSFEATGKGKDIDELASIISQLDCVITVCTTVTYIAGALGIPCYVLVPSVPSYRYHLEGGFDWYDSVHLIRQEKGQEWSQVVNKALEVANVKNIHRVRPSRDSGVSRLRAVDSKTLNSASELHPYQPSTASRIHEGA